MKYVAWTVLASSVLSLVSCSYLDIVPPEQADMDDAVATPDKTLGFLYSCYAQITSPIEYTRIEGSADEYALPDAWDDWAHTAAYDLLLPSSSFQPWNYCYKYIGQCLLFLENLPKAQGLTETQRMQWEAEAWFLIAYYHFEVLRLYGPCPITDSRIAQDTPPEEYCGRQHYDAVTDWIVDILDNHVINEFRLPTQRNEMERGRPTHATACALKARVLLYAASPLWNGSFPYKDWRNKVTTSYNGVDYGYELVSTTYDPDKWERARVACEEALAEARAAGHALYENLDFYSTQNVPLNNVYVPGGADDDFKKRVLMLRYLLTANHSEGNTEFIWGVSNDNDFTPYYCQMPWRVLQQNNGNWIEGYNSYSPYLNAVEKFYDTDGDFYDNSRSDLLSRANVDEREDVINLVVGREPRFYAWMAFDGGDWGTMIADGSPVTLDFKNPETQGYNPEYHFRDHNITGFLSQKFVRPNAYYDRTGNSNIYSYRVQRPLIRMAELYLNLAECYAMQGNVDKALENLNEVHERAGLDPIETSDITEEHTLMDWIRNERFVEFYGEGLRFFDIRRWCLGPEYLSEGIRTGLNAEVMAPTFEEFNRRVEVPQPYKWSPRMYIAPILQSEIGKNTNLVQAPGY